MKYIITERQYRLLTEEPEEILEFPFKMFNNDWNFLQEYLEMIGNPPYKLIGNLDLSGSDIKSLGNLQSVGGWLDLRETNIKSLGTLQHVGGTLDLAHSKIKSLGNLESVGDDLSLYKTNIQSLGNLQSVRGNLYLIDSKIKSLGNLQSVGGYLNLTATPLSKTTTEEEIKSQIEVGGSIYL